MSRIDIANQVIAEFNKWQKCEGLNGVEVEHSDDSMIIRRVGDTACVVATKFSDDFEDENGGVTITPWGDWTNWDYVAGYTPNGSAIPTNLTDADVGICAGLGRAEDDFNIFNYLTLKNTVFTSVKKGRYKLTFRYAPGPDILEQDFGLDYVSLGVSDYRVDGGAFYLGQTDGTFPIFDAGGNAFSVYVGDEWKTAEIDFEVVNDLPYFSFGFGVASALPVTDPSYPHYTLVLIDDVTIKNRCPFN